MKQYSTTAVIFLMCILGYAIQLRAQQALIEGPSCVISGKEYQYNVAGSIGDSSDLKICVTGGRYVTGSEQCTTSRINKFVRVIWNENTTGKISIESQGLLSELSVKTTGVFKPGNLVITENEIWLDTVTIPPTLHCENPSGAHCTPVYRYQWQYSEDYLTWREIPGAVEPELQFNQEIKRATYIRRKVLEENSKTIGYSDILTMLIKSTEP
jgi:hypothetical protein